jgi:DNA polymerase I
MPVKISNPPIEDVVTHANLVSTGVDPLYEDLMDWAKTRKRQFLRNRVQQSGEPIKVAMAESTTRSAADVWIETWYTPPSLPSRVARQRAIAAVSSQDGAAKAVQEVKIAPINVTHSPVASNCSTDSGIGAHSSEVPQRSEPEIAILHHDSGFEIGQPVVLRPDARHIPAGMPRDAVLVVQERYINAYRQHQNIWCIWCSSDGFSGLKSIDSDCLMPLPEPVLIAIPDRPPKMDLADFRLDETGDLSSSSPAVKL